MAVYLQAFRQKFSTTSSPSNEKGNNCGPVYEITFKRHENTKKKFRHNQNIMQIIRLLGSSVSSMLRWIFIGINYEQLLIFACGVVINLKAMNKRNASTIAE
uniref:Uncharacterized protein n=1 Tax=Glossina brevipalpis TaxID=37001 RepID=A0A1A9WFJ2_9MUSC